MDRPVEPYVEEFVLRICYLLYGLLKILLLDSLEIVNAIYVLGLYQEICYLLFS